MRYIDLRSDTVTMPTEEMREAMANAAVGDDVYGDDPTVNELEQLAANILGKEAALFTPSGTMANQLAIMTHTNRGDEIILGRQSHIVEHEVGACAVISQVSYAMVDNPDASVRAADIRRLVRIKDLHYPDTGLVCLENALGNGTVIGLDIMKDAYAESKSQGMPLHLDGARLFNAAVFLGVEVSELAACCDSLMFCISKGLAAPVGSILAGERGFIAKARRNRKLLGGGMRQAGTMAAAGLIALNKMTKRLHIDHENAQYLAQKLAAIPYVNLLFEPQINMVFFSIDKPDFDHTKFVADMLLVGIKINGQEYGPYRYVTHNDVTRQDLDFVLQTMAKLI